MRGVNVPVAGVYRGLDDPGFEGNLPPAWCRWAALALPVAGGPAVRPLVLADDRTLLTLARNVRPWATCFAAVDPATARAGDAAAVARAIRGSGPELLSSSDLLGPYQEQDGLGAVLARATQVRAALGDATRPAAPAAVLVALLLVAAAGGYWAERRAGEVRLLAARGIGPPGLGGKAVLEMLGAALAGAVLGWAATLAVAPRLGPSSLLDDGAGTRALRTVAVALLAGLAALGAVAGLRGVRPDPAEIDRLLALLGLTHRARHLPGQLSGGEQQRLAVACPVLGRPSLFIADEPTAELDSASADRVLGAFADLGGEGVAFVVSSHDPRVVERTDHLLRLDRGRPVESW